MDFLSASILSLTLPLLIDWLKKSSTTLVRVERKDTKFLIHSPCSLVVLGSSTLVCWWKAFQRTIFFFFDCYLLLTVSLWHDLLICNARMPPFPFHIVLFYQPKGGKEIGCLQFLVFATAMEKEKGKKRNKMGNEKGIITFVSYVQALQKKAFSHSY